MKTLQEDLKLFFLGLKENKEPYLYKNKDLTTHATIVGMTGSGKTGLGITLLEEACIDNIPSIIIDPKGDMTNLCLSFPNLTKEDFLPYIDEDEAKNSNKTKDEMAQKLASTWQSGLEASYQDKDRIRLFKESAEFRIYTPKSSSGLSVSLLRDFVAPKNSSKEELDDYVLALSSSLLLLIGIKNQSVTSPEIVLLQNIFLANFKENKDLNIVDLIHQIANPPFDKVGVSDLESFYPSDKRMALAMKLNGFFASPSFSQWCMGDSLDISKMLFTKDGKARCNIFTISHLSDDERVFFVALLLNEIVRWMRTTEGTYSLRMVVYMDEIFGFFPPNGNPPTKKPMLTLLKQARAHGVGVVLSMQNPVDLDYKGLSNMGTWFIGRLQTAQDKERIISGITGVSGSDMDKSELLEKISNLNKREFLVKNVHEDGLQIIGTRFALSYLKGPLSSMQIDSLMAKFKKEQPLFTQPKKGKKPLLSPNIKECYSYSGGDTLRAYLYATAKVRFYDKRLDYTKEFSYAYALDDTKSVDWDQASINPDFKPSKAKEDLNLSYEELPSYISSLKDFKDEERKLKDYLYRNAKLELFNALGLRSEPQESKEEFMLRLHDRCNEVLEKETESFSAKFKTEQSKLQDRLFKAEQKLSKEKANVTSKILDVVVNVGSSIIGGFLGNKVLSRTNVAKAASGARSATRALNQRKNLEMAQYDIDKISTDLQNLVDEYDEKIKELKKSYDLKNIEIKIDSIAPKKSDIFDEDIALLWKN